jgi:hypothetical protein
MWCTKPYKDAVDLQRLIVKAAPLAEDKDLAAMTKSFVALEMLKLRLKMKPAPKPIDTTKAKPAKAGLPSEPLEP